NNYKDFQHCLFACFLSQIEPKKIFQALEDDSWVDAMQEELLQFKIQKEELEKLKRQEKEDNDVTRKEATHENQDANTNITNLLNAVSAPISTVGPSKVLNDGEPLYPDDLPMPHLEEIYASPSETVQIRSKVHKNSKAHALTASTPIETQKPLVKDEEAADVDVHRYRFMISSLMYLTASRPDIMFAVCACSRFQATPKTSHLQAIKRIFRYLKGQPKLGLWYPKVSSFDLEAYSDSDYAGENLDRKSTTGGCQFLGRRLISWQCKRQTIMATSTTEAEYVAAGYCCGQVL
nr:uncharacterized mitochondrial protein AtMg00810-like [Tanacetum cinerariifolium]